MTIELFSRLAGIRTRALALAEVLQQEDVQLLLSKPEYEHWRPAVQLAMQLHPDAVARHKRQHAALAEADPLAYVATYVLDRYKQAVKALDAACQFSQLFCLRRKNHQNLHTLARLVVAFAGHTARPLAPVPKPDWKPAPAGGTPGSRAVQAQPLALHLSTRVGPEVARAHPSC